MKDLPPMDQIFILGVHKFVMQGVQQVSPLFVKGNSKAGKARLFGQFFGHIFYDKNEIILGKTKIVSCFQP